MRASARNPVQGAKAMERYPAGHRLKHIQQAGLVKNAA